MKVSQLLEYGRIVLGVNTTKDVSPNEIPKQARKWGFKVDKDGRPPTLSKKVKGKSTNVLFNLGLAESIQKIDFKDPNFEQEWNEAQRYSEFKKIGKDAWIDLAKQGDKVDIDNALSNKINNTEAGEKDRDSFKNLEKDKQERFVKDLASNNIELPIIARYSDDHLELIGGKQPGLLLSADQKNPTSGTNQKIETSSSNSSTNRKKLAPRPHSPSLEELEAHEAFLMKIKDPLWLKGIAGSD